MAARRVVPPDLMAPVARSPILRNDMTPDDLPPPESLSFPALMEEKLDPAPAPKLEDAGFPDPQVHDPTRIHKVVLHAEYETSVGEGRL